MLTNEDGWTTVFSVIYGEGGEKKEDEIQMDKREMGNGTGWALFGREGGSKHKEEKRGSDFFFNYFLNFSLWMISISNYRMWARTYKLLEGVKMFWPLSYVLIGEGISNNTDPVKSLSYY